MVVKHSILSGLFAALAALFGKLSTTPSITRVALKPVEAFTGGDNLFEVTLSFLTN